jgi:DNA-directed RNA polymerase specialized sigma24 family protein
VQQQFVDALPAIQRSVRFLFRHRRRDRDDLLAEVTACAWKAWRGLSARGRDPLAVGVTGIGAWAARHALKGRRIANRGGGGRHAMDVFHRRAQRRDRFRIVSYDSSPVHSSRVGTAGWNDWMLADHRANPADQAIFNLDFSAWLAALPSRSRAVVELLATGHGTGETAALCQISAARVSQLRIELRHSWMAYQGEGQPPRRSRPGPAGSRR